MEKTKTTKTKVCDYKNLSREQQEKLFNENIRLAYHMANKYFVREGSYASFNDLEQHAFIGLWNGIRRLDQFDPRKSSLSKFLCQCIRGEVSHFIYKVASNASGLSASVGSAARGRQMLDMLGEEMSKKDKKKLVLTSSAVRLDKPVGDKSDATIGDLLVEEDETGYANALNEQLRSALEAAMNEHLSENERLIIRKSFGFDGDEMTLADIGREMGKSGSWAEHQRKKALAKLRHPRCSKALNDYR